MGERVAVAVTTAPRAVRYLDQTLESLLAAGIDVSLVCHDPANLGIVPTFRMALNWLVHQSEHQAADWYAVIQDDVIAEPCLLNELPPPPCIASLYLSEGRTAPAGWSVLPDDDEYPGRIGGCGFVMDRNTAVHLVESPPFTRTDRLGTQLVLWCRRHSIPFWLHSPSLLTHIGEVSAKC